MSTTNYFKINPDGAVKSVIITEKDINLDQSILQRFSTDNPVKIPNFISSAILPEGGGLGNIGVCVRRASIAMTIRLATLPMRTAFKMNADNLMVPDFKHGNEDNDFVLHWTPPDTMRLYLVINFSMPMKVDVQFLVAIDPNGRHYRLPLSNLYEDARLCHGVYDYTGGTLTDMMCKAWTQFNKSRWQSDLVDRSASGVKNSMKMFRFKPLEPQGFEQLTIEGGSWETLSERVSTVFIQENIVI